MSFSTPAAKLLKRIQAAKMKPEPYLNFAQSKSDATLPTPPVSIKSKSYSPAWNDLLGVMDRYGLLLNDAVTTIYQVAEYTINSKRLQSRQEIVKYFDTIHALKVLLPSSVYTSLPFKKYTWKYVTRYSNGIVPTSLQSSEMRCEQSRVINDVRCKFAASNFAIGNCYSSIVASCPALFYSKNIHNDKYSFAKYLNFPMPLLFPLSRLVMWCDWIIKDDLLIARQGIFVDKETLIKALEERGFKNIPSNDSIKMQKMLKMHCNFTQALLDLCHRDFSISDLGVCKKDMLGIVYVLISCRINEVDSW